ncbi:acyl-CoA thioesterase [Conexibacter arvalis]|uniref:Acyl-CoA thioester hydrolase n=1 Tax=Conexibacter arvalis TaxID=912552 RepID=A0A840ID11_9ACTN|nr:thioesterase family protein [Conexibacter arvalis]MBB4661928.1 acyl-CoA thioester hydrolase [Conexibacter arvalis]
MSDERRGDYAQLLPIPTRWADNDIYGHVNNVEYYAYFDTLINTWLIAEGGLDIHGGETIGVCAESSCRYYASFSFPEVVEGALRVGHLGRSSVRYEIGLFKAGMDHPAALGEFVHVFVDREQRRPTEIPQRMRAALERLLVERPDDDL